jgi:Domain of unknown function DUF11
MARRGFARTMFVTLLAGGLMAAGLGGAGPAAAVDSPCPPQSGRQFCVSVSHTPADVSTASAGAPTFVAYQASVRNVGKSTLTNTTLTACLVAGSGSGQACAPAPSGASFYSAAPSAGACTITGATARCELGSLGEGGSATVELVARAPTQPGPFQNVVTVRVKERASDSPRTDPNEDTLTVAEPATALAAGSSRASSFVPEGIATELLAAQEDQSGRSKIPSDHDALTASLSLTDDPPLRCPKDVVCRGGRWVSATIPGVFESGLQFVLRWPDKFVPRQQTERNFVLLYIACDTCAIEIIRNRCSSATPGIGEMPCLWNVRDLGRDGFEATLISPHNGKMH